MPITKLLDQLVGAARLGEIVAIKNRSGNKR
jgi:hypothetical protein